jgi:hypothetical protein
MAQEPDFSYILSRLQKSKFRTRFKLNQDELSYIERAGLEKIEQHAFVFIQKRLAAQSPANDGRQTPFKGHPVFKAQHATATCCRSCLKKWHAIADHKPLNSEEIEFVVSLIMQWIKRCLA